MTSTITQAQARVLSVVDHARYIIPFGNDVAPCQALARRGVLIKVIQPMATIYRRPH